MRVLVTGANGFVGQHLVKELAENGIEVVGVGGRHGSQEISEHISSYLELDLLDKSEASQIDFTGIDGIIHLAGMAVVGQSFEQPMEFINTNIGIEVNLFEAAIAQKASPRFVIVSSGTLYDPKASQPLTEDSRILPSSPYAVSKLGQEQMAQYYSTRGLETIIVRPFNHIGPGQGLGLIVPDLAQQVVAFSKGQLAEILVGNLDSKRDYTDVRDIVRAYRLLLANGEAGETYNICSGNPISGHEILEGLSKAADCKPVVKQDPSKMRPSDIPVLSGSHQKLSDATGWKAEIPIETTLADVIADWRSRT